MAVSLREYRARIKSTESMKKITRAMELIAASRIIKAQQRAQAAAPYARELTRAVSAVATFSNVDHPLTTEPEDPKRAARPDRDQRPRAGRRLLLAACSRRPSASREARAARARRSTSTSPVARASATSRSASATIVQAWTGFSDQPTYDVAREIGDALIEAFLDGEEDPTTAARRRVDEVHVVYTRFRSMLTQEPTAIRLLPLEVVEGEERPAEDDVLPLYEFEPSPAEVLDALLPRYVQSRIYFALLQAAASELAARQRAMKSATDNADRAHQEVHADRQPGPPGRDHPGNQRDRRWRQRPRRRQRRE